MDQPVNVHAALATFEQLWSPRIVTRMNDYDIRIAKVQGEHVWHAHDETDEFFMVLDGEFAIEMRDRVVVLAVGDTFVVPRGVEHRPASPNGASILMFEPSGTSTTGDRHEEIPDHVDSTTGHSL